MLNKIFSRAIRRWLGNNNVRKVKLLRLLKKYYMGHNYGGRPDVIMALLFRRRKVGGDKTGVSNDPLGQIHILASSAHCFLLKFALFRKKWGRTDR